VPIVYEDGFVMVLDKPAGMATHGSSGRQTKALANFLAAVRPALCAVGKSVWEPGLVHRLDRDTSGLVLVAKNQASFEDLRAQFRHGLIKKKYWALVSGKAKREGVVSRPLARDSGDPRRMTALLEQGGQRGRARMWKATTRFRLLGYGRGFSLLEVSTQTGVTHQIRAHLAAIGHPLAGDPLYGGEPLDPLDIGRHFLHAFYLGFRHPKSGRDVVVESPLPRELKQAVDRLGLSRAKIGDGG